MAKQQAVTDLHLVRALLGLHAAPNPRILDASYGRGAIWRGLPSNRHASMRAPASVASWSRRFQNNPELVRALLNARNGAA